MSAAATASCSSLSVGAGRCDAWSASTSRRRSSMRTGARLDRKSTRLNSSHDQISYAVFCLKKKKKTVHCQQERTSKHLNSSNDQISHYAYHPKPHCLSRPQPSARENILQLHAHSQQVDVA